MTLGKLANPLFKETFEKLAAQDLPVKASFKLKVMSDNFKKDLARYEELRMGLLTKYAVKDEEGKLKANDRGEATFEGESMRLFVAELNDLQALEVENRIDKVSINALGDKAELSAQDLLVLEEIIG